jgi:crossover junction endodeoxyribonuclease RuvC
MSRLLSLDLATTMGWAMLVGDKLTSGSVSFDNKQWDGAGMRYLKFRHWLEQRAAVGLVITYEAVENHGAGGTYASHIYGGWLATLQSFCEEHQYPYAGFGVTEIKKFWTGKGSAKKDDMIKQCWEYGHNPKDDNEADAIALLYLSKKQLSLQTLI